MELLLSLLSAIVGLFAAILIPWVAGRTRKLSAQALYEAKIIAQAAQSEEAVQKAATLEAAIQMLPVDQEHITTDESTIAQLLARQPTLPLASSPVASAVEGLISSYHQQALSQARIQFWFSVASATAGFAWILYAGMDIRPENPSSLIRITPGVIMDSVAFLFFKQASETRERATDLYDRLRKDKQMSESRELMETIGDERVRSFVQAHIALHMAGIAQGPVDLSTFLSKPE